MIRRVAFAALLGAFAALSILAADQADSSSKTKAKTTPPAASAPASGVVVFKDPDTGRIRQPDASEIGAMTGAQSVVTTQEAPATSQAMTAADGTPGMRLGADTMVFMTVTKSADGKLVPHEVVGEEAAKSQVSGAKKGAASDKNDK